MEKETAKQRGANENATFTEKVSARWDAFRASPVRVFLLALAFAVFFCVITELSWVKADLNDDYTIASVLSGRLMGDDQGLCLFLNAVLCGIIYQLNSIYPHFNWFAVLELCTVFISYLVICYLALRHLRVQMALLAVALCAYYSLPGCFTINNFTYVAFICSCAGCMLLCRSLCLERHAPLNLVAGLLLLTLGTLWRNIMAWLCVPLFGIAALAIVFKKHADGAALGASIVRLWPFVLAVVLSFGLTAYDLAVWKASPWDDWRTFNDERSMLSDFPHYKYNEIKPELEALGVSRNDYELLFSWISEDPDFYTTQRISAITDVAIIDWAADKTLPGVIKKYAKGVLGDPELLVLVLGTIVAGLAYARGRGRIGALAVIVMALVMALFFSAMGRLPERVHYPIWLYAFCAMGMIQIAYANTHLAAPVEGKLARHAGEGLFTPAMNAVGGVACILLALAPVYAGGLLTAKCADTFTPQRLAATFDTDDFDNGGAFTRYIHEHPNNVYVLHNAGHRQLRMEHYMKAYYDDALQYRVISLGGWLSRSPYNTAKNASADMANPIKGLVDNNNAFLVVSNKDHALKLQRYLREHYYPHARGEIVDTLDKGKGYRTKLYVYKFSED